MCGKPKKKNRENFYKNTDPLVKSGYAAICSECARKIALRTDENGEEHKPTKESIILALQYLNKPFLENVYNSSVQAAERNAGIPGAKQNAWSTYIRTIAMQQYSGKQFKILIFLNKKLYMKMKRLLQML